MALHWFQLSIKSFFKKSIYVRQRGLIRLKIILVGDGAIALGNSLDPDPWHLRVNLGTEYHYSLAKLSQHNSVLIHPRQREGPIILKIRYEQRIIISVA